MSKANSQGYRIKVAVIAAELDLGGIPSFFGKPREYAHFLGLELALAYKSRLLVVMHTGFGVYYGTKSTATMYATLKKISFHPLDGDDLLRGAATAVKKLSAPQPPKKKKKSTKTRLAPPSGGVAPTRPVFAWAA